MKILSHGISAISALFAITSIANSRFDLDGEDLGRNVINVWFFIPSIFYVCLFFIGFCIVMYRYRSNVTALKVIYGLLFVLFFLMMCIVSNYIYVMSYMHFNWSGGGVIAGVAAYWIVPATALICYGFCSACSAVMSKSQSN